MEFALAVVQTWGRGGAASPLCDGGLALTGLASLGSAQDTAGSLRFHREGSGKAGKEKSGSFPHIVIVTYPEVLTEVC